MKHFYTILFFCTLVFAQSTLYAQVDDADYGSAAVTSEFCVSLDTDAPISENYMIDISHLHFDSELDAINKFGFISNNLLTYTVDYAVNKAYLQIHLDRTPDPKDIHWWNDYINSLCGL